MPDWSYNTILKPVLFRLPSAVARALTLETTRIVAAIPPRGWLITLMGHMHPPREIKCQVGGINFSSPVGLGAGLDVEAIAAPGLARFGFGFLEVGPVTLEAVSSPLAIQRRVTQQAIIYPARPVNKGLAVLAKRLHKITPLAVPLAIRLAPQPGATMAEAADQCCELIRELTIFADFLTLEVRELIFNNGYSPADWTSFLSQVLESQRKIAKVIPLFLCLPPDLPIAQAQSLVEAALQAGVAGVLVSGGLKDPDNEQQIVVGKPDQEDSLEMVRFLRRNWATQLVIIGAGGIQQPQDALNLLEAGADLVQLHSGLVFNGPGLPKRCNEAIAYFRPNPASVLTQTATPRLIFGLASWIWATLLGLGMIAGGILAWIVAATVVVLPYDEKFVGLARDQLATVNVHLLEFMAHDRISLAGTMLAIGILYTQLALFGLRRGLGWARQILLLSGIIGFGSFFLFLGYGYFDLLHALVSVLLFPAFLLGLRGRFPATLEAETPPNLRNDRYWRLGLWGQLLLVSVGFGLFLSGIAIAGLGITSVFVPEDLEFLRTQPGDLAAASSFLISLVAHDRAGFGGALASAGVAVALGALWGYRQGARWLWWGFIAAGVAGFGSILIVHFAVGYINWWHLAPAWLGLILYSVGMAFSYPYLCRRVEARQAAESNNWVSLSPVR